MGGLGSGRRATHASVADCRVIEIGELCDAKRFARCPRGEIHWVASDKGLTRARLLYAIGEQPGPGGATLLTLTLRYHRTPSATASQERIVLAGGAGRRFLAECPSCARPVRKLYAPPGAERFLCRVCHGLVYRRMPQQEALAALQAAMGSLLEGLHEVSPATGASSAAAKRSARQALLSTLEEERPLGPQELRIYCLRLAKMGLSVRQIAALVDSSKSSVQRHLAAGLDGIDRRALIAERLERLWALPPVPSADDPGTLRQQVMTIGRHARRLGLHRAPGREPEERVLIVDDGDEEVSTASESVSRGSGPAASRRRYSTAARIGRRQGDA